MKKELFKLLVAEFEKLGVNPTQWLGTRTNVKRIGKTNLSATPLNKFAVQKEFDEKGVERILKLFEEEGRYLAQLNDSEATQLLANIKTVNKIAHPAPKPEAGIYSFSKLPGKGITPAEFTGKKAADQGKLDSAILKASMESTQADQDLAKRLNLDMSKISDFEKLQVWKDKHGVPDFAKDEGIASLFKVVDDNPLADLGTQLDAIEKEGKSLAEEAQRLTDMAWKMSPEGQAAAELTRKDINRRASEGKGFAGGVFGARNDGFFRAVVRPFLLEQHAKGKIKLADNTLESLKQMDDLKGGGDFMSADPVRVFRQHYGDDAFDLIPNEEAFGGGQWGPTSQERVDVLEKVIGEPLVKVGPDNPGGYLTKGEYQAKLDQEDEVLRYINEGDGRFGSMSEKELAAEIAETKAAKDSIKVAMDIDYPPTGTTTDLTPIKSEGAVTKKGFTDPFKTVDMSFGQTKDRPSIRLIKNFERDLTDIELAKEGYNLQEIDILMRARRVMKEEGQNPDDALAWVRGQMADDAGVDIEEFMPDFDWGDFPGKYSTGGGVGSMFRTV